MILSFYKRYLDERMSLLLRNNLIIRSQAEGAREAERQRIAADFHDGPLQSFISFQMRLEVIKKLMARDPAAALEELRQLQDLCRGQVADLRSFVRSMRPVDEGMSLSASLSRMVDSFQRDAGIFATFTRGGVSRSVRDGAGAGDPADRARDAQQYPEAFRRDARGRDGGRVNQRLSISVEDNGAGFPFSGKFTLDELERCGWGRSASSGACACCHGWAASTFMLRCCPAIAAPRLFNGPSPWAKT